MELEGVKILKLSREAYPRTPAPPPFLGGSRLWCSCYQKTVSFMDLRLTTYQCLVSCAWFEIFARTVTTYQRHLTRPQSSLSLAY